MGVLDLDENKTGDMIDILQHYQNKFVPLHENGSPVSTVLYGDGLSCERAHDAQKAQWQVILKVSFPQFKNGIYDS